ncbi:MAG: PilN domain-containing protein, partial [Clostridiales bacterium]|nr:PilN domain-containing protein [Clostridiales bacterium]
TESSPVFTKYVLPILLLLVLYASTAYLAWSIPSESLHNKQTEDAALSQKVDDLAYVEVEYQSLRAQISAIEAKQQTIMQTTSTSNAALNILQLIETASPVAMVITTAELESDGMVITGYAPDNVTIAEFVVNLRAMERFSIINIIITQPQDVSFEEQQAAQLAGEAIPELRSFSLSVSYSIEDTRMEEEGGQQ